MRKFKLQIVGVTPYMQHRMDDKKLAEWEKSRGRIIENSDAATPEEKLAHFHSYIDENGLFYIPSSHFKQAFCNGGSFVKAKVGNSSRSLKNIVAGQWRILEERIKFRKFDEIDSRSAVNKNVKARIMVHRPKWNEWRCEFTLILDDDDKNKLTQETVNDIIKYAGRYLGVGSYRPEHTGEFGRFELEKITPIK
jgi:hypothetical protein